MVSELEPIASQIIGELNEQLQQLENDAKEATERAQLTRGAIQGIQLLFQKVVNQAENKEEVQDDNSKSIPEPAKA